MIKKVVMAAFAAFMMQSCDTQSHEQNVVDKGSIVDDVIMGRRSIRKWKSKGISRDTLDIIMKHGINAPNGKGIQAYEVRVIDNVSLLKEISDAVVKDNPTIGEREGFSDIFLGAPCVVFVASYNDYDLSQVDCGLLGENIMLSAWSMGIGSCCLGSSARWMKAYESASPYLKRLDFPNGYNLLFCIALGYPDEAPEARLRNVGKVRYID